MSMNPMASCKGTTHVFLLPILGEYLRITTNHHCDMASTIGAHSIFSEYG